MRCHTIPTTPNTSGVLPKSGSFPAVPSAANSWVSSSTNSASVLISVTSSTCAPASFSASVSPLFRGDRLQEGRVASTTPTSLDQGRVAPAPPVLCTSALTSLFPIFTFLVLLVTLLVRLDPQVLPAYHNFDKDNPHHPLPRHIVASPGGLLDGSCFFTCSAFPLSLCAMLALLLFSFHVLHSCSTFFTFFGFLCYGFSDCSCCFCTRLLRLGEGVRHSV